MLEIIRKRRSVRSYLDREVEKEKLTEILKAAMYSPTAWGTRAWEFVVVRDGAMRKALSEATPYAKFVRQAPVTIVVCYDIHIGRRFKEDASICAEHIHLEAVHQGLACCMVQVADSEGPHGIPEEYVKKQLQIPQGYRVQCLMPIGYAAKELPEHAESEYDEAKIHDESWQGRPSPGEAAAWGVR